MINDDFDKNIVDDTELINMSKKFYQQYSM